jgi:hypothetical protein
MIDKIDKKKPTKLRRATLSDFLTNDNAKKKKPINKFRVKKKSKGTWTKEIY